MKYEEEKILYVESYDVKYNGCFPGTCDKLDYYDIRKIEEVCGLDLHDITIKRNKDNTLDNDL